jgi:hypothetical protein
MDKPAYSDGIHRHIGYNDGHMEALRAPSFILAIGALTFAPGAIVAVAMNERQ